MNTDIKCIHHWIIEDAHGGNGSIGICKKCNQTNLFQNSVSETKNLYNASKKDKENN